jgi:heat shock protein HslJ
MGIISRYNATCDSLAIRDERIFRREKLKKVFCIVAALTLCVLLMPNCSDNSNSKLEDIKWFLISYGEMDHPISIIEGTEITAIFSSDDGKLSGSAGCNTYSAFYQIDGSKLSINAVSYTDMACISPEGIMVQEHEFLSTLNGTRSFEADDTTLTIYCSLGLVLNFITAAR